MLWFLLATGFRSRKITAVVADAAIRAGGFRHTAAAVCAVAMRRFVDARAINGLRPMTPTPRKDRVGEAANGAGHAGGARLALKLQGNQQRSRSQVLLKQPGKGKRPSWLKKQQRLRPRGKQKRLGWRRWPSRLKKQG